MATVIPFRGVLYHQDKVGDLAKVVVQPYDKITPQMQREYLERHPYNFVRLNLGETFHTDVPGKNDRYTRAAETLRRWQHEQVLYRHPEAALFVYTQEYQVPGRPDTVRTRKGFIGLGLLEDYGKGVKAHEHTLEGPKADRLQLMRATGHQFGLVFMLYEDPKHEVDAALGAAIAERAPLLKAPDHYGDLHRVWPVADRVPCDKVARLMQDKALYIADGHHRYETALKYRDELRARGIATKVPEGADYRLMCFVNMCDEGLTILPTHRVVHGVQLPPDFRKRLERDFSIRVYPFHGEIDKARQRMEFFEDLRFEGTMNVAMGVWVKNEREYWLLSLKDPKAAQAKLAKRAPAVLADLDVAILHRLILEDLLGITDEMLARESALSYRRGADEALDLVESADHHAAFLLNPTKIEQLRAVAGAGVKMPQKSTDFFPKLLSGLVSFQIENAPVP